jgi:hypothetical protein
MEQRLAPGVAESMRVLPNNSMQRMALRAAADAERYRAKTSLASLAR